MNETVSVATRALSDKQMVQILQQNGNIEETAKSLGITVEKATQLLRQTPTRCTTCKP